MNTTISIPMEVKQELQEFGSKGDTFADIVERLLKSAKERQLQDFLMDDTDCIPIEEALENAKSKWQK